jgi:hypothetical protein
MTLKTLWRVLLVGLVFVSGGCGGLTEPKPLLDEFNWSALENPNDIVESADVAAFFGDISIGGQFKTPTLCYSLGSKMSIVESTITVTVTAASSGSGNCAQQQGGFFYTGVIRNLPRGTYTVNITHVVVGGTTQTYTTTVKL